MKTAVAAAEPDPEPEIGSFTPTWTAAGPEWDGVGTVGTYIRTGSTVHFTMRFESDGPREPYRTTAWVERPKAVKGAAT